MASLPASSSPSSSSAATSRRPSSIDLAAFLLRASLGTMWISHALLKALVFTLPGTAAYFASVGLPAFLAYPAFAAEIGGGLALLAGWRVRTVSVVLLPILLGAAWVHHANGWVHTSTGGGWEYPVFLAMSTIVSALLGAGAFALRGRAVVVARPMAAGAAR